MSYEDKALEPKAPIHLDRSIGKCHLLDSRFLVGNTYIFNV